ncbi:deoxyribodipyrimidine photo-lyase, partial [Streptomyces sp. SID14478]|uniref:deoxyribodipyrimidine photo-lyase n=1 Tax=Streptomyces sp. SID14478 TaxID=2706073 RepID=UPI0013DEC8E5|nr:deoxyribodipyrimidine photo-lyase [Streptomyces sp. SID14478]
MRVRVVLFTSDLRVHDHPPLRAALNGSDAVVPLFVRDTGIASTGFPAPNREAFLADCLRDLDAALRRLGGRLVVRSGDVVDEVAKVVTETDADAVHLAAGVTSYAHRREDRLRAALRGLGCDVVAHDAVVTCVPPGALTPAASDHFAVFTPYHRHWEGQPLRAAVRAPRAVTVPDGVGSEPLPERGSVPGVSPGLAEGGER